MQKKIQILIKLNLLIYKYNILQIFFYNNYYMDKDIINNILLINNYYINRPEIVFTHIDDNIIILKKLDNNINNENRHDINNHITAKYHGFNFKVEKIFNLWNPHIIFKTKKLLCKNNNNINSQLVFTIDKQIRDINEPEELNDNDIIMHNVYYLDYYKSLDVVVYKILNENIDNIYNFIGECYTWDDSGKLLYLQHFF